MGVGRWHHQGAQSDGSRGFERPGRVRRAVPYPHIRPGRWPRAPPSPWPAPRRSPWSAVKAVEGYRARSSDRKSSSLKIIMVYKTIFLNSVFYRSSFSLGRGTRPDTVRFTPRASHTVHRHISYPLTPPHNLPRPLHPLFFPSRLKRGLRKWRTLSLIPARGRSMG